MANTFTGYYSTTTTYQTNDHAVYGGKLYKALTTNLGASPVLNPGAWAIASNTFTYKSNWTANTTYNLGDTVRYANVSFLLVGGTSNNETPGVINSNWKVFNSDYKNIVTSQAGDMQYEGATLPQRIPVGNTNQILAISANGTPVWLKLSDTVAIGNTNQVLTLASNGQVYWKNSAITSNLGDLQYQGANGVYISLPVGDNGTVLRANANNYLYWSDLKTEITTPVNQSISDLSNTVNTNYTSVTYKDFFMGSI
jgi:hypothetical protein